MRKIIDPVVFVGVLLRVDRAPADVISLFIFGSMQNKKNILSTTIRKTIVLVETDPAVAMTRTRQQLLRQTSSYATHFRLTLRDVPIDGRCGNFPFLETLGRTLSLDYSS